MAVDTHADDITVVNGHTERDMQFAIRLERQQLVVKQIDITRVNVTHSYMAHTAVCREKERHVKFFHKS